MGKIIQKNVRKSLPVLLIMSMIGLLVSGVYFNLNFDLVKLNQNKSFVSIGRNVLADTASTSVSVINEGPIISAAAENPVSTSTSPVNIGSSTGFTITASDGGLDNYWLIVCDADGVAVVTAGNPPTCASGYTFCVSSATSSSGSSNSCTDASVPDPGTETYEWYAYACDDHATDPKCSLSSQGMGGNEDSDSPLHINHPPVFSSVSTTDNDKVPGGTFTFEGVATDSDVLGEADQIYFYVCSTDSWNASSGCTASTLCSGTSTSPNVSCSYTDPGPPTPDADYTYYAFVKDFHEGVSNNGNSRSNTYTIINVSPVISNVVLNEGNSINLNLKWAPEVVVYATSSSVSDDNGCADLVSATSTIYLGTVTDGPDCAADDNNCYQTTHCAIEDCVGTIATVNCSTTIAFHAVPTDADHAAASATGWMTRIQVMDEALASSSSFTGVTVDVISSAGLDIEEGMINYGNVQAGTDTGSSNATTTVVNFGNTPIDTGLTGEDMISGANNIPISNQEHSLAGFAFGTGTDTSSTTISSLDTVIPRPTTSVVSTTANIYWGIGVPSGTPSGDYAGYNTFAVIEDSDGNWSYP